MSPTLVYIILGYVAVAVLVYFIQDRFIFKPEKLPQDFEYKYDAPFEELFFDVAPVSKFALKRVYHEEQEFE